MTASTRFIGLALIAWVGVRAFSLGILPGGAAAIAKDGPPPVALPPPETAELPPIDDRLLAAAEAAAAREAAPPGPVPPLAGHVQSYRPERRHWVQWAMPDSPEVRLARAEAALPRPRQLPYSVDLVAPRDNAAQVVAAAMPRVSVAPSFADPATGAAADPPPRRRRLELSAWALMRGKPGDLLGPNSLSTNEGTLGGSQTGARITYWIGPRLAASLRASTPLGGARGGEVALGVRFQPFRTIPIALTAERRQRFGRAGGRNDFALFVEGGLYDRPMPAGFRLDAYGQFGVVGVGSRDLFGDGAVTFTRPLWRNISGGFGVWGGAQPGLYRLDAGPRLSIRMTKSMRVHLDYRQRLLGVASPSSGPAVTIAGDF